MKRERYLHICAVFLSATFLLAALAGCGGDGGNPSGTDTPAISDAGNGEAPPPADSGDEPEHTSTPPEGDTVTVGSVEELLEAISPHTEILLKPGYYNMSEYLEHVWEQEGESWNKQHPYVQLQKCYDGVEVLIRRVDGLSIRGDSENLTEIVVEPRYAQVLNFEQCHDLTLSGLTMGHTETGACSGDVLNFFGCRNINLSAMDLYGCGVYGIACYDGTGELYIYNSTIRDCAYGALNILDGNGRFELRNCGLTGSAGYDQYEPTPYSELAFYECVFGANETSYYMFHEDIHTEGCVWSESYEYPEYGYEDWAVFDPDTMESANLDEEFLIDTFWAGHAMVNPESGETVMLPYQEADGTYAHVSLELNVGDTCYFETAGEYGDGTWAYDEEDSIICVTLEDGRNYYASAWTMGGEKYIWLLLELEECMVWLLDGRLMAY